ncbi:hypothetical protein TWF102_007277 [Orbilia oligospora]|uniref:Peptidase A1 domain-containing protein n=1 Tax=Orbilia oligospora TaxID=2813651 RepID=A0A7C8K4C3_ORBOL|nr:hypothetical protein TWF706_011314 [Orbilia oligospora]KAF3095566.1 hypothetical protein TWF102_007277 [Orbilia oligospora]KAF3137617.1 hypothetical protein TWF703_005042 [Orbilia oligospora]
MFKSQFYFPVFPMPLWTPLWSLYFINVHGALYHEMLFDTSKSFGYDGPWYTVPVAIGSNEQTVNLFPGSQWAPTILSTTVCEDIPDCVSKKGGLYNYESDASTYPSTIGFNAKGVDTVPYGSLFDAEGQNYGQFAQIKVGNGFSRVTIANASISRVESVSLFYGRKEVGMSNGFLTLGAVDDAHVFGSYRPVIPLNNLAKTGVIASRSWGMHYPSAKLNQLPSLVWGGYDRSRISGPIERFDADSNAVKKMDLIGMNIDTAIGKSPFSYQKKSNLLVNPLSNGKDNVLRVELESALPYLVLPQETCDAIAEELPVTFDRTTGFYFWETSNPLYQGIVTSPSYLSFDFRVSASQNFTIKIPFALLDLNLTAPLVTTTQAYFPCMGARLDTESGDGAILGRAFYQAAFIAQSYETRKFWIAQAPGPSYTSPDIRSISKTDISLDAPTSRDDIWIQSWNSTWKVVPFETTRSPPSESSSASSPTSKTGAGISTGAIAGIAAGAGTMVLLILLFLVWRRKKRMVSSPSMPTPSLIPLTPKSSSPNHQQQYRYPQAHINPGHAFAPWELPGNGSERWNVSRESGSQNPPQIYELH